MFSTMEKTLSQRQVLGPDDELFTTDELAARLKIKKDWIYQRIHSKTLPFEYTRVGGFLRFPASSVYEYLRSQMK